MRTCVVPRASCVGFVFVLACQARAGNGGNSPSEFKGRTAFSYVEKQMSFGPRIPNKPGHEQTGAWLLSELRTRADTVIVQEIRHVTHRGDTLHLRNFFARFRPQATERVLFLAHWDNKASNQRLVCLDPPGPRPEPCRRPFAIIQDVGSTFGPKKVDLPEWKATPIWTDARRCTISMRKLPYNGGTFPDAQITEEGRQLIARQLAALDERQILSLFSTLRFEDANAWTQAFLEKVSQITDAGPCPS